MKKGLLLFVGLLFYILLYAQPANNTAATAVSLSVEQNCTPSNTTYTTENATQSVVGGNNGQGEDDVWFSFVANANAVRVAISSNVQVGNSNPWNCVIELWSGSPTEGSSFFNGANPQSIFMGGGPLTDITFNAAYINSALITGNTYFVRVYSFQSSQRGNFKICLQQVTVPVNDACKDAATLTVASNSSNCSSTNGTTVNAVTSDGPTACSSTNPKDVWYKFTATSTTVGINVSNIILQSGSTSTLGIQLNAATNPTSLNAFSCAGNQLSCSTTGSLTFAGLTVGTTYFIRVYNTDANSSSNFSICVFTPTPPANDNCNTAFTLPINNTANAILTVNGNTTTATSSGTNFSCAANTVADVWFTFTPTAAQIAAGTLSIASTTTAFNYALFTGSCGSLLQVGTWCGNSNNLTLPTLTAGITYYLRAYNFSGDYSIGLITLPTTADACADAIDISSTVNTGYVGGHTNGAAVTSGLNDCFGFAASYAKDVWYKATVSTAGTYTVDIQNLVSRNQFPSNFATVQVQIFTGSCGSLTSAACVTNYSSTAPTVTLSTNTPTTYLIRVIETSNSPGWFTFNIGFKLVSAAAPQNDNEQANGFILTQDLSNNAATTAGTFANATLNTNPAASVTPTTPFSDVWYTFVATSTNPTISVSTFSTTPSNVRLAVYAYPASTNTTVLAENNSATLTTSGLTIGTRYSIRVYYTGSSAATTPLQSNFSIRVIGYPTTDISDNVSSCTNADVTLTSTGSNSWLHFVNNSKLVLSVYDGVANAGEIFTPRGNITASFFTHTSAIRTNASNAPYLNRNFGIDVQNNNINNNVRVRFYLSKAEFDALVSAANSNVVNLNDLRIARITNSSCNTIIGNSPLYYNITGWGTLSNNVYFIEGITPDFSGFFLLNVSNTLLPAICKTFTYTQYQQFTKLQWQTEQEVGVDYYEVQKSTDGFSFITLEKVFAKNATTTYVVNDNSVLATTPVYYKLKMVNKDGTASYLCSTLQVSPFNNSLQQNVKLYPNPVYNKQLHIQFAKRIEGPVNIQILTAEGKMAIQQTVNINQASVIPINITKLAKGIFTVRIINNNNVQILKGIQQ